MTRIFRQHWPLAAAIIIFCATISVLFLLSAGRTQGHFIYALDDPFIHMAMAKNFAARGVWGVTKYEFSSSTSSILWTLLISFCYLLAGTRELIPFFLNVVFATLVIVAAYLILKSFSISLLQIFLLLLAIVFLTPLPTLVFSGMEHSAQIFIDTCFVFLAARILLNQDGPHAGKDTYILLALAPLVTAIRYEGLFLICVVALLFLLDEADEAGAVGDLLAEVIACAEHFTADAYDVVGVIVILGKDEGFGEIRAARKHFGEDLVAESGEHGANLIRCNDVAVEFVRRVGENIIELFPSDLARRAVAFVHEEPGVHL